MKTLTRIDPVSWIKGTTYGLLLIALYHSSLLFLIKQWKREDYTYCWLIPLIVVYLIWDKKEALSRLSSSPSWPGFIPFLFGIFLFWLGELGGEYFSLYLSFWLVFTGICWISLGWDKLKAILFPIFFLLAMFPFPNFIYTNVSLKLKLISTQLGVFLMRLYGMSAFREGNVIDLGFTQLQVVDACSGLRYLIPLIVLGVLLAYFFKASWWKKVVLVVSTIPISIVVNSVRIASVGILYKFWGPVVAEGFFHDFSGWFIFMVSLGILVLEMKILKNVQRSKFKEFKDERVQSSKLKKLKKFKNNDPQITQISADYLEQRGSDNLIQPSTFNFQLSSFSLHFLLAVILLISTFALSRGVEFREKIPIAKSFDLFPLDVGVWRGTRQVMEQQFVDELDFSDYVIVDYLNQDKKSVNFYVAYYESQKKGESIHSPETCLPGSGWVFNDAGKVDIPVAAGNRSTMPVNRAFMQKGDYRQLAYYWFPQRDRILTNAYQLKFYVFWDALTRQRTDGALVRVITPVYENEGVEQADQRLQGFVKQIVPVLYGFLPK